MSNSIPVDISRADFFVTGDEYMRDALDLKFIPRTYLCNNDMREGIILADDMQDLRQSFSVAQYVFERVKPSSIKFVLIGLSPYKIPMNDKGSPIACSLEEKILYDYFKLCLDNGATPVAVVLPVKQSLRKTYNDAVVKTFRVTINNIQKKMGWRAKFIDLLDISFRDIRFQENLHFNSDGAAIVSALLSERLYFKNIISPEEIFNAGKDFFDVLSKYFSHERDFWSSDKPLPHHIFSKLAYEDFKRLSKTLPKETCMDLMVNVFSELTYSYLACLADMLSKDDYIELTNRIFKLTVENIRRKDKIKVGFYFSLSSHWCGDDVYNAFAKDEHFEPIIFVRADHPIESNRNEFLKDSKKFKARGFNVFEFNGTSTDIPKTDILFHLNPYSEWQYKLVSLATLKVKETCLAYIPYSFFIGNYLTKYPLCIISWKMFYTTFAELKDHRKTTKFGMPYGVYSGNPKMDIFFKSASKFQFDWKMARPDAKKIIWAPHWSIDTIGGGRRSTFRWNYQLMYEFAKNHPEISWVVKPHPLLFGSAVSTKVFSSKKDMQEYFQKWNELSNAQVYTGAYYQDIFATSDGMIHDSASFIAEYQYVNKPMIFLTREDKSYHPLAEEIFKGSYLVDGRDWDGIIAMIQQVFIEGDDFKAAKRKEVFDNYFNYLKINGMLASEFIFKSIASELKGT